MSRCVQDASGVPGSQGGEGGHHHSEESQGLDGQVMAGFSDILRKRFVPDGGGRSDF